MTATTLVNAFTPHADDVRALYAATLYCRCYAYVLALVLCRILYAALDALLYWSTRPIARILEVSQEYTSQMAAVDASRTTALAYAPHTHAPHIPASASQVPLASIPTAIPVLGDDDVIRPVLDMATARKATSKTARKATTSTTTSKTRKTAVKVAANKPVARIDYKALSRRELQTVAKGRNVKANMTSAAIIIALEAQDNGQ